MFGIGLIMMIGSLCFSYALKIIYDKLLPLNLSRELTYLLGALGSMAFIQMGFNLIKAKSELKLGQKIDLYLIDWVYKLLINRGYDFYNQISHGEMKQLLQDALKLRY